MNANHTLHQAEVAIRKHDFDHAWNLLLPLAELGNREAQFKLGMLRYEGANIPDDVGNAWLEKAAMQDHPDALLFWATYNRPNEPQHVIRAAELGSVKAQYFLGASFATGDTGYPKDEREAVKWYTLAATAGDAEAQYNLGTMILNGEGTNKDLTQARQWLEASALQGNEAARKLLAQTASQVAPRA